MAEPQSPRELFDAFTRLAMQGFGGVLPVAQREIVERREWLTREQFLEQVSVAQVLPGPNIVNLALMVGNRFFGWRGALAATGGILLAPLVLVLLLAIGAQHLQGVTAVSGALRGMGVVSAGLIVSTAIKLGRGLGNNALGWRWCLPLLAATIFSIAWMRWPLAHTVLVLGSAGMALAWWKLRPR